MVVVISPISQKEKPEVLRNWISYPSPTVINNWFQFKAQCSTTKARTCPYHMLQNKWSCVSEWQECSICPEANCMCKVRNFYIWQYSMTALKQERTEFRDQLEASCPHSCHCLQCPSLMNWHGFRSENWLCKWRAAAFPAWAPSFCSFPNHCRLLISTDHLAVVKSYDAERGHKLKKGDLGSWCADMLWVQAYGYVFVYVGVDIGERNEPLNLENAGGSGNWYKLFQEKTWQFVYRLMVFPNFAVHHISLGSLLKYWFLGSTSQRFLITCAWSDAQKSAFEHDSWGVWCMWSRGHTKKL